MSLESIPTRTADEPDVPASFGRLREIVYNLWWSWSPRAHQLFDRLHPTVWRHYRNPVEVLQHTGPERWQALQSDDGFARAYHELVRAFDEYMEPGTTWFRQHHGDYDGGPFAYFSTEYGWHESLQIYSGGLGILSGDHCKSASDLGLPFIGVGLMYNHGYFRQTIDSEGHQQHFYPNYDLSRLPLEVVIDHAGRDLHAGVELPGRTVFLRVWQARVGRVPVLLLDSDLPVNHPADRAITSTLYVQGREMRFCQEVLLGMGGVRMLETLGIRPGAWHMNEGHSALLALERMRPLLERGTPPAEAFASLARNTVFTTHTPVPAGNEIFEAGLVRNALGEWCERHGFDLDELVRLGHAPDSGDAFNMTALAIRASDRTNGVSALHGEVSNRMWGGMLEGREHPEVQSITNGVHASTWVGPEIHELLAERAGVALDAGPDLDDLLEDALASIADHELWTAHMRQKRRLVTVVREWTLEQFARHGRSPGDLRRVDSLLDPEVLTVGFARRFATYKRADLLLRDAERLARILGDPERPIQFLFAGKAHPADRPGQELIRRICEAGRSDELAGRIVFVENYDIRIARHLVQGVDLWLNTPRRPHEASGTSGMKAAMNGVLNCSILDGWWCEGYAPEHGWAIGEGDSDAGEQAQDDADADALYRVLSEAVAPCFYERDRHGLPAAWIRRMRLAMSSLTPRFSTSRMVREYAERLYLPAAGRTKTATSCPSE